MEYTFAIAVGPTARAEQHARTLDFDGLGAYLADRYGSLRWPQW